MSTVDVSALLRGVEAHGEDLAGRIGEAVGNEARNNAFNQRQTGAMAAGVEVDRPVRQGSIVQVDLRSTSEHGIYQDRGTGIHGPRRRRIVAAPGRFFAWQSPGGGWVYARSTAGVPATRWFRRALEAFPRICRQVVGR